MPRTEMQRISTLELLDEVEELDLVLDHYIIAWGVKVGGSSGSTAEEWTLPLQPPMPIGD